MGNPVCNCNRANDTLPQAMQNVETGCAELQCTLAQRVATITFNRPQARNALTPQMKQALARALQTLAEDARCGALLLTGAGAAFCAGGDTKAMAQAGKLPAPAQRADLLRWEHRALVLALHNFPRPTVAALPGAAAGAGLGLALACDFRVFAQSAFIAPAYVQLALSGDYGVGWFLQRLAGPAAARALLYEGARADAARCLQLGIANKVAEDSALAEDAFNWARRLAAGPPLALQTMKENLNRALTEPLAALLDAEAQTMVQSAQSEDYLEALQARREKRAPQFRGC